MMKEEGRESEREREREREREKGDHDGTRKVQRGFVRLEPTFPLSFCNVSRQLAKCTVGPSSIGGYMLQFRNFDCDVTRYRWVQVWLKSPSSRRQHSGCVFFFGVFRKSLTSVFWFSFPLCFKCKDTFLSISFCKISLASPGLTHAHFGDLLGSHTGGLIHGWAYIHGWAHTRVGLYTGGLTHGWAHTGTGGLIHGWAHTRVGLYTGWA